MKQTMLNLFILSALLSITSCDLLDDIPRAGNGNKGEITELRFIDEHVIPDAYMFENTLVGGLSGLDYKDGKWALVSDANTAPIRFYTATIDYDLNGFNNVDILSVRELKDKGNVPFADGTVDPESIRFTKNGNFIWTNEGSIKDGINPTVRFADPNGNYISETNITEKFKVSSDTEKGPRHNGAFEGLTVAKNGNGYWAAMELPLVQDGPAPTIDDTESPIRVAHIDKHGQFGKEFAYELDPIARKASETSFTVNGLVEILEHKNKQFLVLERSFSTGFSDGGNNVKIYKVDARHATDISGLESLDGATYTKAKKELLFDFEDIRSQLTDGVVDNIEGIAFGPVLENGNRSLVVVADNNFSAFGLQLNQFILFEVLD